MAFSGCSAIVLGRRRWLPSGWLDDLGGGGVGLDHQDHQDQDDKHMG